MWADFLTDLWGLYICAVAPLSSVCVCIYICIYIYIYIYLFIYIVTTCWTVRGRIPVGAIFHKPRSPPSLLHNGYWVLPSGKAAEACRWSPTPSSAEVKERVELYLYSPSGASWPVLGWILPLLLPSCMCVYIYIYIYIYIIHARACVCNDRFRSKWLR